MIQLLPGLRIKVSNKHSTYGRVKVKSIQLFLGKYNSFRWSKWSRSKWSFSFSDCVILLTIYKYKIFIIVEDFDNQKTILTK
jgi:hypothetical protein